MSTQVSQIRQENELHPNPEESLAKSDGGASVVTRIPTVARVLLGLVFFVFGLNGFLQFLPQQPMSGPAGDFVGALASTHYMFPLIKGTELIAGILLLTGRFVPLALTLLAPIVVNIALFHLVLAPAGLGLTLTIVGLEAYLAWAHRDQLRPLLRATAH